MKVLLGFAVAALVIGGCKIELENNKLSINGVEVGDVVVTVTHGGRVTLDAAYAKAHGISLPFAVSFFANAQRTRVAYPPEATGWIALTFMALDGRSLSEQLQMNGITVPMGPLAERKKTASQALQLDALKTLFAGVEMGGVSEVEETTVAGWPALRIAASMSESGQGKMVGSVTIALNPLGADCMLIKTIHRVASSPVKSPAMVGRLGPISNVLRSMKIGPL